MRRNGGNMIQKKRILVGLLSVAFITVGLLGQRIMPVMAASQTEVEENNTVSQATEIPLNEEVTGALSSSSDLDYYRFDLEKPSVVSLTYSYLDGAPSMRMELINSEKKELLALNFEHGDIIMPFTSNWHNLPAGSYYVLVKNYYGGGKNLSDYTITVNAEECEENREVEYNETTNTATEIAVNTEIIGNLSNTADKDYYKFSIPANGNIFLEYSYEAGKANMRMELFGIDGSDRSWRYESADDVFPAKTNVYRVPKGEYYMCISNYYGDGKNNSDYTLKVHYTDESGKPYEVEYNGTTSLANIMNPNQKITGNLSYTDDKDYYKFTIDKASDITLLYDYQAGKPNMRIIVLDQNSSEVKSMRFESSNDSFPYKIPLTKLAAGSYYIIVENYYGNGSNNADYSLTVLDGGGSSSVSKPGTVSIQSLKTTAKKATLVYKKVNNVTGYEIVYSKSRGFSSPVYVKTELTRATISNLKRKKTYYFKVRAYTVEDGKTVYGNYSAVKSIKIK